MKKIIKLTGLIAKQYLKNPFFLLLLIALPLCTLFLSTKDTSLNNMELKIGLYAKEPDAFLSEVFKTLQATDSVANFTCFDTAEELERQIKRNELACGYIFENDLQNKLNSGKYSNAIQLLSGPQSQIAASVCNEILFSALLKCNGEGFMTNFLDNNDLTKPYATLASTLIHETFVEYQTNNSTYHVEFESLGESNELSDTVAFESSDSLFPIKGALVLLIFAAGLFGSLQYLQECSRKIFNPMPLSCHIAVIFLYPFILSFLTGLMSFLTLYFNDKIFDPQQFFQILLYCLIIAGYCGLLSRILSSKIMYAAIIPMLLILCLVIYPIFINLEPMVPGIHILRKIFPPGFMM